MEPDVKLTKLASCAGCGAKVGAGTLVKMLDGFRTHTAVSYTHLTLPTTILV